jgi:hypothetical protein
VRRKKTFRLRLWVLWLDGYPSSPSGGLSNAPGLPSFSPSPCLKLRVSYHHIFCTRGDLQAGSSIIIAASTHLLGQTTFPPKLLLRLFEDPVVDDPVKGHFLINEAASDIFVEHDLYAVHSD